jgi:hypothetical protein
LKRVVSNIFAAGLAAALLSACSGAGGTMTPVAGGTRAISDKGSGGGGGNNNGDGNNGGGNNQGSSLSASPNVLVVKPGVPTTFVANSGSGHEIDATVLDPSCVVVSPSAQQPVSTGGGNHVATFTVTSNGTACSTTITLTANSGNTASVAVTVNGKQAQTPAPAPSAAPAAPPAATAPPAAAPPAA